MSHHGFLQVAIHGLCDICSVDSVVVGVVAMVVLLDHDQEPPEFDHVQLKELHQPILVQQVEGQGDQAVSCTRRQIRLSTLLSCGLLHLLLILNGYLFVIFHSVFFLKH